ncbi:ComEA family DNA-binding protein [Collinsella sp. An307]|uniref:ComEA family DNA-binding protein n=1 Tax=Collinsella sp. An307 TaxID=1965630 RepID=UPI001302C1DD|nr:ComEA family DNA-binding protein [Collinsella sp. An307]
MAQAARRSRLRELMFTMVGGGAGTGGLGAITVAAAVLCVLAAAALGMGFGTARGVLIERSSGDGVSAAVSMEDVDSESDDTRQQGDDDDAATDAAHDEADEDAATVTVDVSGAVATPSVVTLAEGSRVADAIDAAGGALPEADLAQLNRAARLTDGEKVHVPITGEQAAGAAGTAADSVETGAVTQQLININTATEAELDVLPGVGPSTAEAIVADREENGPFSTIEDLMRVSGIGEKKFEKLAGQICV